MISVPIESVMMKTIRLIKTTNKIIIVKLRKDTDNNSNKILMKILDV